MVPELAARRHLENILPVIEGALHQAGVKLSDLDALAERLTALFLMNPTSARPERKPPRTRRSLSNRLDYQKRRKKSCF